MSSVLRWRNKHGAKKRRFDVKSGFAHMYHICHAFKEKQNQSSSTDADDPETLWKRHCADANFRSQGDNPKVRYEVFVLKEEALRQGLSPDLWSEEVERIDPHTQQKYTVRVDFCRAVASRELLDIIPSWMKAADGQDVDIPVSMASYVKVPEDAEIAVVFHRAIHSEATHRKILREGL